MAFAAAEFVEDEIARDLEEPGSEFRSGFVARGALPDADEDLLGDILGVAIVAEHLGHCADDAVLMGFHEFAQSLGIALLDAGHPDEILGAGRRATDRPGDSDLGS